MHTGTAAALASGRCLVHAPQPVPSRHPRPARCKSRAVLQQPPCFPAVSATTHVPVVVGSSWRAGGGWGHSPSRRVSTTLDWRTVFFPEGRACRTTTTAAAEEGTRGQQQTITEEARTTQDPSTKPVEEWDVAGLKSEAQRQLDRAVKKVGKTTTKLREAREAVDALMSNDGATLEDLEKCPDVDAIAAELEELRAKSRALSDFCDGLKGIKSAGNPAFAGLVSTAVELGVGDAPPPRQPRGPKKKKGPKTSAPRKPYWTYKSIDGVDIRVGRKSEDNDELSCNPEHRDPADWWMHAAGCPGSHVVIRYQDSDLPRETMIDAAVLSARCDASHVSIKPSHPLLLLNTCI